MNYNSYYPPVLLNSYITLSTSLLYISQYGWVTDHLINMQLESVSGLIKQLQLQQRFPVSMQGGLAKQLHLYISIGKFLRML
jgi:hypothetical protein